MLFLVDTSGSIRSERFGKVQAFIKSFVEDHEISSDRIRVAAVSFANDAKVDFNLTTYSTREDIMAAIDMIQFNPNGKTNMAAGIRIARQSIFTSSTGDRADVPNFIILITDGAATVNREGTPNEAVSARLEGAHIMVVSIEMAPNMELRNLASDPDENNLFYSPRFDDLQGLVPTVYNAICEGKACIKSHYQYIPY